MRWGILCGIIFLSGCASTAERQDAITAVDQSLAVRNQGYSLLYQLLSDEQNLSKLLIIKKESADLGELLKDISRTSEAAAKQLERFSKSDPRLHIKMAGLPRVEEQTRAAIAKTKAKELIAKGGQKFEVRILLAQAEALTYGAHLAYVLKAHEADAGRQKFLQEVSDDLARLHQGLIDLVHSRWEQSPRRN